MIIIQKFEVINSICITVCRKDSNLKTTRLNHYMSESLPLVDTPRDTPNSHKRFMSRSRVLGNLGIPKLYNYHRPGTPRIWCFIRQACWRDPKLDPRIGWLGVEIPKTRFKLRPSTFMPHESCTKNCNAFPFQGPTKARLGIYGANLPYATCKSSTRTTACIGIYGVLNSSLCEDQVQGCWCL